MSWSHHVVLVLTIVAAVVCTAGAAAAFAIVAQIVRQGGWKLAEPAVIERRWRMVRPWMVVGAGVGLLFGIVIAALGRNDQTLPVVPEDSISVPPIKILPRPREDGQRTE